MRLLDTTTGQFVESFSPQSRPRYAILSHTWSSEGEQTHQELRMIQEMYDEKGGLKNALRAALPHPSTAPECIWDDPRLSTKIRSACETAHLNGYRYIWIDSCCIDKSSSSELSEAINSMYLWYRDADMCYVYLVDVPDLCYAVLNAKDSAFCSSRWFTRGWTLQELIAPRRIVFLSCGWCALGTKVTLTELLQAITGIDREVLLCRTPLNRISVARRMSWAAARETTRVEDRAYSLLGIFDINIPTLYGEGDRAFQRLQEEILRRIPDQSLFAWSDTSLYTKAVDEFICRRWVADCQRRTKRTTSSLFASSPSNFARSTINAVPYHEYLRLLRPLDGEDRLFQGHVQSAFGVQATFPVICLDNPLTTPSGPKKNWYLVLLACNTSATHGPHLLARFCVTESSPELLRWLPVTGDSPRGPRQYQQIVVLRAKDIKRFHSQLRGKRFHLGHPERPQRLGTPSSDPFRTFRVAKTKAPDRVLALSPTSRAILQAQGYDVEFYESAVRVLDDPTYNLLLSKQAPSPRAQTDGPSVPEQSCAMNESVKLTIVHRPRWDLPLCLWAVRGPHTLDSLRDLGPYDPSTVPHSLDVSPSADVASHAPITITRHIAYCAGGGSSWIAFKPVELPSVAGFVETLHIALESDCSVDRYYIHAELSVERDLQPPTASPRSSQIQLYTDGVDKPAGSRERLPKTDHNLAPLWINDRGEGDEEDSEPSLEVRRYRSPWLRLRKFNIFRLFRKRKESGLNELLSESIDLDEIREAIV